MDLNSGSGEKKKDMELDKSSTASQDLKSEEITSLWEWRVNKKDCTLVYFDPHFIYSNDYVINVIKDGKIMYSNYTVYIKLKYGNDDFIMAGNQFGWFYNEEKDILSLKNDILNRVNNTLEDYGMDFSEIIYINVAFRLVDKVIFSKLKYDKKDILNSSEVRELSIPGGAIPTNLSKDMAPNNLLG